MAIVAPFLCDLSEYFHDDFMDSVLGLSKYNIKSIL